MVASNVPMSSRENAACQVRCSRHSYLHHWLHVSSSINGHVQYPVCARSAPSRLDACALISSHSAVPLGSLMRAAPQSAGEMKKKKTKKKERRGKKRCSAAAAFHFCTSQSPQLCLEAIWGAHEGLIFKFLNEQRLLPRLCS